MGINFSCLKSLDFSKVSFYFRCSNDNTLNTNAKVHCWVPVGLFYPFMHFHKENLLLSDYPTPINDCIFFCRVRTLRLYTNCVLRWHNRLGKYSYMNGSKACSLCIMIFSQQHVILFDTIGLRCIIHSSYLFSATTTGWFRCLWK